jgi:mannose-6-phosphate isomerase-like protein (cupin superfamily)
MKNKERLVEKTNNIELEPRAIKLDISSSGFQRILAGPPATVRMKSGMVSLKPGEAVGTHNTDNKEELIIVLEGEGKMVFDGYNSVKLSIGENAYCPPFTEHNIINTKNKILKYIYVVSILGD